jgi:hypothetical protein
MECFLSPSRANMGAGWVVLIAKGRFEIREASILAEGGPMVYKIAEVTNAAWDMSRE